jgi:hypothetical protein
MTPEARKAQIEAILKNAGIPYLPSLPYIESDEETRLRSAEEIGIRIACLFGLVGTAFHTDDKVFADYLREHELWNHLTAKERFFLVEGPSDLKRARNLSWRCEAMVVLMWSVHLFETLPLPREQTETKEIVNRFPGVEESPWPWIRKLSTRNKAEILDASDLIYRLHWATRQAGIEKKPPPGGINPDMVQEWHHAINWVTRYDNQEWDDVATDT